MLPAKPRPAENSSAVFPLTRHSATRRDHVSELVMHARVALRAHPARTVLVHRIPGIYEVTPMVDLDEDGAAWRLDAVVGHFEGRPVPVRFRGGEGALFTELPPGDARRVLR